jgi:hypothetical protein
MASGPVRQSSHEHAGDLDAGWRGISSAEPRHPRTEHEDRQGDREPGLPEGQRKQHEEVTNHSTHA